MTEFKDNYEKLRIVNNINLISKELYGKIFEIIE